MFDKKYILPAAAGAAAILAVIILVGAPGKDKTANVAEFTENGELLIRADALSGTQVSFIRISDDSRIELLARLGDDGKAKVALGTCQSCNGSPDAYYTQEGDVLKCNNCGLTFPLSVIDSPGGGCHPIMIDGAAVRYTGENALININAMQEYEDLFAKVAKH